MAKLSLENLPSIDRLLTSGDWAHTFALSKTIRKRVFQETVAKARACITAGQTVTEHDIHDWANESFHLFLAPGLKKVINATGVVLHTNLGRAPIGKKILASMSTELDGYSSLEIELKNGERGDRTDRLEKLIAYLVGAEASIVVNNNAAALFLTLRALGQGKKALISRGELVQIGGGFKIPEILEEAQVNLVEVGTTNMTSISDYETGFSEEVALCLKVHHSNFVVKGHTHETTLGELSTFTQKKNFTLVMDLGGGLIQNYPLPSAEPTVSECLKDGADLVCFSADKLLGGVQAGFVVGKASMIKKIKKTPLYRAMRLGKTEIFILESLLAGFCRGESSLVDDLLKRSRDEIKERAEVFVQALIAQGLPAIHWKVVPGQSSVGGGTMPGESLETVLIEIKHPEIEKLRRALLSCKTPVVVRTGSGSIWIDLRTVLDEEGELLTDSLLEAFKCLS